jgi:hypothetical protein
MIVLGAHYSSFITQYGIMYGVLAALLGLR